MLDGRVKTLNPKIYSSILFIRNNLTHKKQFQSLKVPKIDIVIVNLYPFKKFSKSSNMNTVLEMIDIGGPSLIRAASKNYKFVTTIINTKDYSKLIKNIEKIKVKQIYSLEDKWLKRHSTQLQCTINIYLIGLMQRTNKKIKLRYGENPNQESYLEIFSSKSIFDYQISGKKISYNNIIDIDSGLKCLSEFIEPTCIIIKHTNPCGVASSKHYSSF